MPGATLSSEEVRLIEKWREDKVVPSDIAERLDRDKSTITRHLAMKSSRKVKRGEQKGRRGPKRQLTDTQVAALIPKMEGKIKTVNAEYEVTMTMIQKSARVKVSVRKLRERLAEQGVSWHAMRTKPTLTDEDIEDRHQFGKDYKDKPKPWWKNHLHMVIDVKHFPIFLHGKARRHFAQTGTRGVYRKKGQALTEGYYKPNTKLKFNTGTKGVHVLAGVGDGKVLLWEYIEGRWNSHEAERIYSGPMKDVLKKTYPHRTRFNVLEDNDPTGFRSKIGMKAKVDAKIDTFEIPKRSPQLNICDYWLWKTINCKMRQTERTWPTVRKEKRDAYLRRLKRTAMSLTEEEINTAMGSMKRRSQDLVDAKGKQIEG